MAAAPFDENQLRTALKQVFEKFDADGSGAVSTDEMTAMVKQLKMDLSASKIRMMMVEADPDRSGEVDFEEFVMVVKKQIAEGRAGGLAEVVSQAGGFFGFFGNIFGGLFGGGSAAAPAPAAPSRAMVSTRGGASSSPPPAKDAVGDAANSLFDRYSLSPSEMRSNRQFLGGETRTTRLRSTGVKLSVYLNTEVDRGRATVISLPEECDTLGEVMPMIQRHMQLDRRMLYAAELYLPDGKKLTTYNDLVDAAALDTAIIVGCGEPFDSSSIPYDILEFHLQGGGRQAADKIKKILQDKRKEEAREKADMVRAAGHGLDSRASITSREAMQDENRESAMMQRQEYMEQLMYRAAQQKNLMDRVYNNNMMHKMEQDEARAKREEFERVRLETLADQRKMDKDIADAKKAAMDAKIKKMHDKVKGDFEGAAFYKKSKRLANISRTGSTSKRYADQ